MYTAANFAAGVKVINFAGVGAGLTVGVTRIVSSATDLNGNSSEFSSQRTLASGAARLSAPAQQNNSGLDLNSDGFVSSMDAMMLISFIENNNAAGVQNSLKSAESNMHYDTNGDGAVSLLDALSVIREIQKNKSNLHAVTAIDQLVENDIWDLDVVDLIARDLADVREALLALSQIGRKSVQQG